jgi:hypothetical protein
VLSQQKNVDCAAYSSPERILQADAKFGIVASEFISQFMLEIRF